jgi:hypothetical protein
LEAAEVGVLSHKKKAAFWNGLVELFPNIIDYLCNPNVNSVSDHDPLGLAWLGLAWLGSARLAVRTFTADRIVPLLRISCERCERRTAHSLGLLRDSPGCRYRRVSTFSMATGTAE